MKYFEWTDSVYLAFSKTFPGDHSDDALCLMHKYIKDEYQHAVKSKNEQSLEKLFFCLGDFYKHFCWKINWQNDSVSSMKKSCVNLLAYIIQTGVILSKGKPSSKWVDSVLTAMNVFPGPLELLCDSLILVYNINKKFRPSFAAVLKHFLFSNKLNVCEAVGYFKIMLLLRRLKFMSENKLEKARVVTSALSIRVPSDCRSWLLSHGIGHLKAIGLKSFAKTFLGKKLSPEFFKELRVALEVEVQLKKNLNAVDDVEDLFAIDTETTNQGASPVNIVAKTSFVKGNSEVVVDPLSHTPEFVGRKRRFMNVLCEVDISGKNEHNNITSNKLKTKSIPYPDTKVKDNQIGIVIDSGTGNQDDFCGQVIDGSETFVNSSSDVCILSSFGNKKRKKVKLTKSAKVKNCNESPIAHSSENKKYIEKNEYENINADKLEVESFNSPPCSPKSKVEDNLVLFEPCDNVNGIEGKNSIKEEFEAVSTNSSCQTNVTSLNVKPFDFCNKRKLSERCCSEEILTIPIEDKSDCVLVNAGVNVDCVSSEQKNKFLEQVQLKPSFIQAENSAATLQNQVQSMIAENKEDSNQIDAVLDKNESLNDKNNDLMIVCTRQTEQNYTEQFNEMSKKSQIEKNLAHQSSASQKLSKELEEQNSRAVKSSCKKLASENLNHFSQIESAPLNSATHNRKESSKQNDMNPNFNKELNIENPSSLTTALHKDIESDNDKMGKSLTKEELADENSRTVASSGKKLASNNLNHFSQIESAPLSSATHNRLKESSKQNDVNPNFNKELNIENPSSLTTALHKDIESDNDKSLSSTFLETAIVSNRNATDKQKDEKKTSNYVDVTDEVSSWKENANALFNCNHSQNEINDKMSVMVKEKEVESPAEIGNYIEKVLFKLVDEVVSRVSIDSESSSEMSKKQLIQEDLTSSATINMNKSMPFSSIESCLTFSDVSKKTIADCKQCLSPATYIKSNPFDYREAPAEHEVNIEYPSVSEFPELDGENESSPGDHFSYNEIDDFGNKLESGSAENHCEETLFPELGDESQKFLLHSRACDSSLLQIDRCIQSKCEVKSFSLEEAADFIAKSPQLIVKVGKKCDEECASEGDTLFRNYSDEVGKEPRKKSPEKDHSLTMSNHGCKSNNLLTSNLPTSLEEEKINDVSEIIVVSESNELLKIVNEEISENKISSSVQVFSKDLSPPVVNLRELENTCNIGSKLEESENKNDVENSIQTHKNTDCSHIGRLTAPEQVNQSLFTNINQAPIAIDKNENNLQKKTSEDSPVIISCTSDNAIIKDFLDPSINGSPLTLSNLPSLQILRQCEVSSSGGTSSSPKVAENKDCSDPVLTSDLGRLTLNSPSGASKSAPKAHQSRAKFSRKTKVINQTSESDQPEINTGYNLRSRKPLILPGKLKYPK